MTAWTGRASPVFMCATLTRMVHIPTAMMTFRWSLPRQRLCNPRGFTPPVLGSLPLNISAKHQTFSIFPIKPRGTPSTLLSTDDYGHWTRFPFCLPDDPRSVFSYSQPLILPDGTVYGVVGIGLLSDPYLRGKLPTNELQNEGSGSYLLCSTTDDLSADTLTLQIAVCSSHDAAIQAGNTLVLQNECIR